MDPTLLASSIAASIAIMKTEPSAYIFMCAVILDGIQIDFGVPMYDGTWAGRSLTADRYVLLFGMNENDTLETNAHEWFHTDRRRSGLFDWNNIEHEEELAYTFAYNSSNWDYRLLRYKCEVNN